MHDSGHASQLALTLALRRPRDRGLVALYGLYEVVRGAGGENVQAALAHTADIVAFEQTVGIYVERSVQDAFEAIPFAPALLGLAYVLLHFVGTAVALVWVHRRHPDRFPIVRTTFVAATALALVGYVLFPAAPPRLAAARLLRHRHAARPGST